MTARMSILSCALAAFAAFAASVPQTSADKYYFTVPKHPGGISGIVMGDPPEYRVMRSEDIDWLNEAYAERNALRSGAILNFPSNTVAEFGKWQLSTNGLVGWTTALFRDDATVPATTNIVARYTKSKDIPNTLMRIGSPPRGSIAGSGDKNGYRSGEGVTLDKNRAGVFLDPDPSVWSESSSFATNGTTFYFPEVTEVLTTTTTNWTGRYKENGEWHDSVRTNISYITMAMTNGTTSVHTNMFVEILPRVETATTTNILQKSRLGMMFNSGLVELYDPQNPESAGGPFRTSVVTANYAVLRDATVFAAECKNINTNEIFRVFQAWSVKRPSSGPPDDFTTNFTYNTTSWQTKNMTADKETTKSFVIEYEYDVDTDTWTETGSHIDTVEYEDGNITDDTTGASGVGGKLMAYLPTDTVHVGSVDSRIDHVEVYAWAEGFWSRQWSVYGPSGDDGGSEQKYAIVCQHIGRASYAGSAQSVSAGVTKSYECFSATIPNSLLNNAMSSAGKSFPQSRPSIDLEKGCPDPNKDHPASSSLATESWNAYISEIILVIHLSPWTSLPGW